MTLEPALLMSPCDGCLVWLGGPCAGFEVVFCWSTHLQLDWHWCWTWSWCLMWQEIFSWWSDGCLLRGSFGPALLVLACFVSGTLCWIGVEPVLRNKFGFEVGACILRSEFGSEVDACCNMNPVDDVWGVVLYKVMMNYKIFSFYSGKFFYFLPNLIQVFWIMILSHFHLISDFYCPKQTTH